MKTINIIVASALAGALLACNPLTIEIKPAKGSFTAQGDGYSTKTSLSGASILWSSGDAIKVFNGTDSEEYTIESGVGEVSAVFTGNEIDEAETYYAVYPYSDRASLDAGVLTATVPATQYGVANSFDKDINLAVACSNNHTLQFKNVCGFLRFQIIESDINTIVISSNSGAALAGEVAIGFDGAGNPVVNSVVDGSSSVTLTPKTSTSFSPGVYIVAVLPGTYTGGITVNMTKQHAKEDALRVYPMTAVKAGSSDLIVSRSVVKRLGVIDQQVAWECLGYNSIGVPVGPHNAYSSWGQYIDYQSARTFCAVGAYNYSTILDACFAYSSGFGILSTSSTQASTLYNSENIGYIVSTAAENDVTLTSSSLDYIENWTQENSLTTLTTNFISLTSTQLADDNAYNALSNYSALRQVYLNGFKAHSYNNNTLPMSVWTNSGSGYSPTTGAKITTTGNYYAFKIIEGDDTYFGVFKITTYNTKPAILKFIYKIACSREGTPE